MSRSRRREQGHPAKIAARRERKGGRREPRSPVEAFCAAAAGIEGPLEAELFISELLGMPWSERGLDSPEQIERELGGELLDEIAVHGGTGAAVILAGMRELAGADLAAKAADLAASLADSGTSPPEWVEGIGNVEVVRTAMMSEDVFDDGRTYFIESVRADGGREAIGIYVDHNLGCSAKDILPADSIARVEETMQAHGDEVPAELTIADVEPTLLAARVRAALDLTDQTLAPVVEDGYAGLRAFAFNRVGGLPAAEPDPGYEEVPITGREALLKEFLAAPEGAAIEPGSDAAGVVETAIDYCADYVDGRPLRWSPVVVELFMADWLPRKVVADEPFFAAVGGALAAWVRYAARKRGQPPESVDLTLAAISEWEDQMHAAVADPDSAGPGAQLMAAMKEAGVDPTDEVALQTFLAGWNARSTLG